MSTEPDRPDRDVIAYVDEQLHGEKLEAFLVRLSGSTDIQGEVARHEELRDRIGEAYGPGPDAEDSDFLLPLLNKPQVRIIGDRHVRGNVGHRMRPQWLALAASLVLGFGVSQMLFLFRPTGSVQEKNGTILADSELLESLEHRPQRDLASSGISLPVTFRSAMGFCRVFAVKDELSGIACRNNGSWRIETVGGSSGIRPKSPYQQASSNIPAPVMAQVDELITGDPMTEQEVSAAIGNGWLK